MFADVRGRSMVFDGLGLVFAGVRGRSVEFARLRLVFAGVRGLVFADVRGRSRDFSFGPPFGAPGLIYRNLGGKLARPGFWHGFGYLDERWARFRLSWRISVRFQLS